MRWRGRREPVAQIVDLLRRERRMGRLLWLERLPATPPRYATPRLEIHPRLLAALGAQGIERLFAHQAEAFDRAAEEDLVIVTPTASGKSLCFLLPMLDAILREPGTRALLVYPTNALLHDQERVLRRLLAHLPAPITIATLTGATPPDERRALRQRPPAILLTNVEMLHMSLLGGSSSWARFYPGLRFVVLDEAHIYRGLFGTHVAYVLRRLLRMAALHGARPRVIAATATIGNPTAFAEALFGRPCAAIEGVAGGRGERLLACWQPEERDGWSRSAEGAAAALLAESVRAGAGTILFVPTRMSAERAATRARALLDDGLARLVTPYRHGYAPAQRRALEERLKRGELRGVVATTALEVGIDIGDLDVAIVASYPGTRASLWQQLGRAGRGERTSLGIFVPYPRPVDSYLATHPAELLDLACEEGCIDLSNETVGALHLACAAAEAPLREDELAAFGESAAAIAARAVAEGLLRPLGGRLVSCIEGLHGRAHLRGVPTEEYALMVAGKQIGAIDAAHLGREAYPGALYLHEATPYRVLAVDPRRRVVELRPEPAGPRTVPMLRATVHEVAIDERTGVLRLAVRQTTSGYRALDERGESVGAPVLLEAPIVHELHTRGIRIDIAPELAAVLEGETPGALATATHALEHLLPAALAVRLGCDPRDVLATAVLGPALRGGAVLFLYDSASEGAGIAERAQALLPDLLRICDEMIAHCRCRDGCPRCVLGGLCWQDHGRNEKRLTRSLLSLLREDRRGS